MQYTACAFVYKEDRTCLVGTACILYTLSNNKCFSGFKF